MDQLYPALIQIPFIGAFIWFAIRMSNDYREDAKARDKHWMEFLAVERDQRKEIMGQGLIRISEVTDGMCKLTDSMANLAQAIVEHNSDSVKRLADLKDALR